MVALPTLDEKKMKKKNESPLFHRARERIPIMAAIALRTDFDFFTDKMKKKRGFNSAPKCLFERLVSFKEMNRDENETENAFYVFKDI